MSDWGKFFAVRLPIAALAIGLLVEAIAATLNGVTLHRHNVDDLANAVLHDPTPYRVVLIGDSVTHNVANKYRIGAPGEVADLTTHAKAGLPSYLFLLERYLESGRRPSQVVIATSPHVLVESLDASSLAYYVTSTFRLPAERAFIRAHYGDLASYAWRPAALNMTTRIGEPLFSLLRHPSDNIRVSPAVAPAAPVTDAYPDYAEDPATLANFASKPYGMRPEARAIVRRICELGALHHLSLHVIWAPTPVHLHAALAGRHTLDGLADEWRNACLGTGTTPTFDDSSAQQAYPYFNRDLVHIRGEGWEQVYANQLAGYVRAFEAGVAAQPPGAEMPR